MMSVIRKPRIPLGYKNKLVKEIIKLGTSAGFGMAGVPLHSRSLQSLHELKEEFERELNTMSENRKEAVRRTLSDDENT